MPTKCYVGLANELSSSLSASTGFVFFIAGLCLGIMSSKSYIYLFDSHSRDPYGRIIQDGTSVLLRFKNMLLLSKYIISTYFAPPLTSLQYEIQFVSILMDNLSFSQKTLKAFQRKGYFPSINSENSIGDLVYSSMCRSYHQGCIEQFGISAGMQCSCNALYSLVYSAFNSSLNRWGSTDLDIILLNGDLLYEEQHKSYFLSVPDLPQKFKVWKVDCLVEFQFNCFGFIVSSDSHVGLTHDLSSNLDESTGIVSFIAGFCLGILKCEDFVYLFDSHSRDAYGRHVPDGHSVLLRLHNM